MAEHVDVFDFEIIIIWSLTTILKQDELGEDYTHWPDVHFLIVPLGKNNLWASVPSRANVGRQTSFVLVLRRDGRRHDSPCQSKVTDLDCALHVNKNIGRLDVSVHHVRSVDEIQTAEQVVKDDLYVLLREMQRVVVLYHLLQVVRHVLHHEENTFYLCWLFFLDDYYVMQLSGENVLVDFWKLCQKL